MPPAPIRKQRTTIEVVQDHKNFEEECRRQERDIVRRRELCESLNSFVRNRGGWVVSPPSTTGMRIECRPDSELPDLLAEHFELQYLGNRTRAEGKFIPVCVYGLRLPPMRK